MIDGDVKKSDKTFDKNENIFDDIFRSLTEISKYNSLCIINSLNPNQKKCINVSETFRYNNKICVVDETIVYENQKENQSPKYILVESSNKNEIIAECDTSSIIHLVLGGDINQIEAAVKQKPNSKFIFFNVNIFFVWRHFCIDYI